jgi:hypothetical protein
MKMDDLRAELGPAFIKELTNSYLDTTTEALPRTDLRSAIDQIRSENYEPIILEMELAMYRVIVDKCHKAIEMQQTALGLEGLRRMYSDASIELLGKMLEYQKGALKRKSRSGGNARGKKYEVIAEEARRLARAKVPESGRWTSIAAAARAIVDDVLKFADAHDTRLTGMEPVKLVSGYLKDMDDAATLFATKQGASAS